MTIFGYRIIKEACYQAESKRVERLTQAYLAEKKAYEKEIGRLLERLQAKKVMANKELDKKAFDMYPHSREGREGYIKGFCDGEREGTVHAILNHPCNNLPKIHGWVARELNGALNLYEVEPARYKGFWWDRDYTSTCLDPDLFPDLTWEDEPIEVELLIRKV